MLEHAIRQVGQDLLAGVGIPLACRGIIRIIGIKNVEHAIVTANEDHLRAVTVGRIVAKLHIRIGLRGIVEIGIDLVRQGGRTDKKGIGINEIAQAMGPHAKTVPLALVDITAPQVGQTRLPQMVDSAAYISVQSGLLRCV